NSYEHNNYTFQPNNPYLVTRKNIPWGQPNFGNSILALEATIQIDPQNANAWHQLGLRQQENEQEAQAISALRKAVALDPSILDAWLALAVSYENESQRSDLYDALESWLKNHDKYAEIFEREQAKGPI